MNLDMKQLGDYQRDLEKQIEARDRARHQIDYLRLQIKQTRARAVAAKRDLTLRAFMAAMPADQVEVMPAPDGVYASVTLSPIIAATYRGVPEKLGLTFLEQRNIDDSLGSPILRKYRHGCVMYYVTEQIR